MPDDTIKELYVDAVKNGGLVIEELWPNGAPDLFQHVKEEEITNRNEDQNIKGLNRSISYVSKPNITVFCPPREVSIGTAVVISPGGGFSRVVIDKEGYDIAGILNEAGITAVVLKYRTMPMEKLSKDCFVAFTDVKRAVRMVRDRAGLLGIRPDKIGVMGFSAGGCISAIAATFFDEGVSGDNDCLERISSRPDFACLIYPGVIPEIIQGVSERMPPMFIVCASDDKTTPAVGCTELYDKLISNGVSAELHLFKEGGHGFGLGRNGRSVNAWPQLCINWINGLG